MYYSTLIIRHTFNYHLNRKRNIHNTIVCVIAEDYRSLNESSVSPLRLHWAHLSLRRGGAPPTHTLWDTPPSLYPTLCSHALLWTSRPTWLPLRRVLSTVYFPRREDVHGRTRGEVIRSTLPLLGTVPETYNMNTTVSCRSSVCNCL